MATAWRLCTSGSRPWQGRAAAAARRWSGGVEDSEPQGIVGRDEADGVGEGRGRHLWGRLDELIRLAAVELVGTELSMVTE